MSRGRSKSFDKLKSALHPLARSKAEHQTLVPEHCDSNRAQLFKEGFVGDDELARFSARYVRSTRTEEVTVVIVPEGVIVLDPSKPGGEPFRSLHGFTYIWGFVSPQGELPPTAGWVVKEGKVEVSMRFAFDELKQAQDFLAALKEASDEYMINVDRGLSPRGEQIK